LTTANDKGWLDEETYQRAIRALPIACVDLLVSRPKEVGWYELDEDEVLLVRRANEPLAGHWWFPGGRIHLGETRLEAGKRKLKQECGLTQSHDPKWLQKRVHDVIVERRDGSLSHSLTTVFWVEIEWIHSTVILDAQSIDHRWRSARAWLTDESVSLHPWVQHRLQEFYKT